MRDDILQSQVNNSNITFISFPDKTNTRSHRLTKKTFVIKPHYLSAVADLEGGTRGIRFPADTKVPTFLLL